jgi:hypothetical protein
MDRLPEHGDLCSVIAGRILPKTGD